MIVVRITLYMKVIQYQEENALHKDKNNYFPKVFRSSVTQGCSVKNLPGKISQKKHLLTGFFFNFFMTEVRIIRPGSGTQPR